MVKHPVPVAERGRLPMQPILTGIEASEGRMSVTRGGRAVLGGTSLAVLTALGCFTPPVHDSVLLVIEADGSVRLKVETTFAREKDQTWKDRDQIRRAADDYLLGRDAWLRGFERAGAREVTHELRGADDAPEMIVRDAMLPSMKSLEEVLPDSIANFDLIEDHEHGLASLRIIHIDLPESMRDGWRRLEKETGPLSELSFELSERQCDLYDYLAGAPARRLDVATALSDPDHFEGALMPEEDVLVENLRRMDERFDTFWENPRWGARGPLIAAMRFSPFDFDLCVQTPAGAIEIDGFAETSLDESTGEEQETAHRYCAELFEIAELLERVQPSMDPPMRLTEFPEGLAQIEGAPFTCERPGGPREVETRLWALMLPRPRYVLSWRAAPLRRAAF